MWNIMRRRRRKNRYIVSIKHDLKEVVLEFVNWIELAL
jgi:hypothetical protein